jgi:hypothetical protein
MLDFDQHDFLGHNKGFRFYVLGLADPAHGESLRRKCAQLHAYSPSPERSFFGVLPIQVPAEFYGFALLAISFSSRDFRLVDDDQPLPVRGHDDNP